MKNKHLVKGKDLEIQPRRIEFRMKETDKLGSLFINILIKRMIVEWYFIQFLSFFIYIVSEVKINYYGYPDICMFILSFLTLIFNEWNKNIK
jgi:hypothetical protein